MYSRHKCSLDELEEQGEKGQKTRQVGANASAKSEEASEESADGEEERNQHKGEHESCHQEIVSMVINKVLRDVLGSVEVAVAGRVERERRVNLLIVRITTGQATVLDSADIPVCPS
jgi:hypothetical protein